jgi:hypothetical protein
MRIVQFLEASCYVELAVPGGHRTRRHWNPTTNEFAIS